MSGLNGRGGGGSHAKFQLYVVNGSGTIARKPFGVGTNSPRPARLKRNCSPSENMYFLISLKLDFGLNLSEYKINIY